MFGNKKKLMTFLLAVLMLLSSFGVLGIQEVKAAPEDLIKQAKFVKMPVIKPPYVNDTKIRGFAELGTEVHLQINDEPEIIVVPVEKDGFVSGVFEVSVRSLSEGDVIRAYAAEDSEGFLKVDEKLLEKEDEVWTIPLPEGKRVPMEGDVILESKGHPKGDIGNITLDFRRIQPLSQCDGQLEENKNKTVVGRRFVKFIQKDPERVLTELKVTLSDGTEVKATQPEEGYRSRTAEHIVRSSTSPIGDRIKVRAFDDADSVNIGYFERKPDLEYAPFENDPNYVDSNGNVKYFELQMRSYSNRIVINRYEKARIYYQVSELLNDNLATIASRGYSAMRPMGTNWKVSLKQETDEIPGKDNIYSTTLLAKGKTAIIGDDKLDGWLVRQGIDGKIGKIRFYLKPDISEDVLNKLRTEGASVRTWVRYNNQILSEFSRDVVLKDNNIPVEKNGGYSSQNILRDDGLLTYELWPSSTKINYDDDNQTLSTVYSVRKNAILRDYQVDLYIKIDERLINIVDEVTFGDITYNLSNNKLEKLEISDGCYLVLKDVIGVGKSISGLANTATKPVIIHFTNSLNTLIGLNQESFKIEFELRDFSKSKDLDKRIKNMYRGFPKINIADEQIKATWSRKYGNRHNSVPLVVEPIDPQPKSGDWKGWFKYAAKYPTKENIDYAETLIEKEWHGFFEKARLAAAKERLEILREFNSYFPMKDYGQIVKSSQAGGYYYISDFDKDGIIDEVEENTGINTSPSMFNTDMDELNDSEEVLSKRDPIIHKYEWYDEDDNKILSIDENTNSLTGKIGSYSFSNMYYGKLDSRRVELWKLNELGDPISLIATTKSNEDLEGSFKLIWDEGVLRPGDKISVYIFTDEVLAGKDDIEDREEGTLIQKAFTNPEKSDVYVVGGKSKRPSEVIIEDEGGKSTVEVTSPEGFNYGDKIILTVNGVETEHEVVEINDGVAFIYTDTIPEWSLVHVEIEKANQKMSCPMSFHKHNTKIDPVSPTDREIKVTLPENVKEGDNIVINVGYEEIVIKYDKNEWKIGENPITEELGKAVIGLQGEIGSNVVIATHREKCGGGTRVRLTKSPYDAIQDYDEENGKTVKAKFQYFGEYIAPGSIVRLTDKEGKVLIDNLGNEITGTIGEPIEDYYPLMIPLTDIFSNDKLPHGTEVCVQVEENGEKTSLSNPVTLDLQGPVVEDPVAERDDDENFFRVTARTEPDATGEIEVGGEGGNKHPITIDPVTGEIYDFAEIDDFIYIIAKDRFGNVTRQEVEQKVNTPFVFEVLQPYIGDESVTVIAPRGTVITVKLYRDEELVDTATCEFGENSSLTEEITFDNSTEIEMNDKVVISGVNGLNTAPDIVARVYY